MGVSAETLELGLCCACEEKPARAVVMLPWRTPRRQYGWGCVVCELAGEGAVAVLCEECREKDLPVKSFVDGPAASGGRLPFALLNEPWAHDDSKHPELAELEALEEHPPSWLENDDA